MATDPAQVGGRPPTLWDGGPSRTDLVIRKPRVTVDRRRLLWRDSATILVGLVVALLAAQALLPGNGLVPAGSPTPAPSGIAIGSFLPQLSLGPGETFGPIIDPSLGIDATPTPIPVITLGPSPSPSPSPTPTPTPTPKPSTKPTPKPTPTRTPTPTPTPAPTPTPPPPPPTVSVSCDAPVGLTVSCTGSVANEVAGSEVWDMIGSGVLVTGGDGSTSITWTYTSSGTYDVKLTVTGLDGSSASGTFTVNV